MGISRFVPTALYRQSGSRQSDLCSEIHQRIKRLTHEKNKYMALRFICSYDYESCGYV